VSNMRRVGVLAAMFTLLGGCLHETYTAALPTVRPEGPAANVLHVSPLADEARVKQGYMLAVDEARAQLGWMLAYQVNGHFAGYTDAEKVLASSSRAFGLACEDDRDTRMKITYPGGGGLWAMPVHLRLVSCPAVYRGWPKAVEFAGAGQSDLLAAARALGMTCSAELAASVCRVETSWIGSLGAEPRVRRAILRIDAAGQMQVTMEGFEGAP
jgi:hypothetical protein